MKTPKIKTHVLGVGAYLHVCDIGETAEVLLSPDRNATDREMQDCAPFLGPLELRAASKLLKKLAIKLEKKIADSWFEVLP